MRVVNAILGIHSKNYLRVSNSAKYAKIYYYALKSFNSFFISNFRNAVALFPWSNARIVAVNFNKKAKVVRQVFARNASKTYRSMENPHHVSIAT